MSALPTLPTAMEELPRSGIRAVMDRAWELGEPITHLEVGEPGFATRPTLLTRFVARLSTEPRATHPTPASNRSGSRAPKSCRHTTRSPPTQIRC